MIDSWNLVGYHEIRVDALLQDYLMIDTASVETNL